MIHQTKQHQDGFTLIELMLAMAFVATLLLAVATTVIQMSSAYTHGLILNEINKASRTVSAALTTDIQSAQPGNLTDANHYVQTTVGGKVIGGRLCLGNYSYIWNTAQAWQPNGAGKSAINTSDPNVYNTSGQPDIYLVKVPDAGGYDCTSGITPGTSKIAYSASDNTDLIDDTSHDLVLQNLTIQNSFSDVTADESLYIINLVISSNDTQDQTATNPLGDIWSPSDSRNGAGYWTCAPPSLALDFTRCAVQQFSIAVRAGNGDNS